MKNEIEAIQEQVLQEAKGLENTQETLPATQVSKAVPTIWNDDGEVFGEYGYCSANI